MARQLLNLPINIPWKQIAVSPDMMDTQFCNKLFPFAWRSSLAISAYEPNPDELPEELCGDRITYLKITASITGYQPSKEETDEVDGKKGQLADEFPNVPEEDIREAIDRIIEEYFACYGVLLNVAVFPHPITRKVLTEKLRIKFAELEGVEPGTTLDNPFVYTSGITFEALGEEHNRIVDIFPKGGNGKGELDLHKNMAVIIPSTEGLEAVEAKVVHYTEAGVAMAAFKGTESVGTQTAGPEQGQVHKLYIEGEGIDRVIFTASDNQASLLEFAYFVGPGRVVPLELEDYPHIIALEPQVRDLYQAATDTNEILTASSASISTNKSLVTTEQTETGFSVEVPIVDKSGSKIGGIAGERNRTDTDQRTWAVQTDASRERRESEGTTTQLSQMYNLLTGYHAGTNRSVHLMLARPHVLQPTDRRTFVQGLRAIEGMQEFFLIVSRPRDVEGLCVETSLETGHFPENVDIETPEQEFDSKQIEVDIGPITVSPSYRRRSTKQFHETRTIFNVNDEWEFDFQEGVGGIEEQRLQDDNAVGDSTNWAGAARQPHLENYSFNTEEPNKVVVTGKIRSRSSSSTTFHRRYRVHLRKPKATTGESKADVSKLLITGRGLCACFRSGEQCPETVSVTVPGGDGRPGVRDWIVAEWPVKVHRALLTREATRETRLPAMKELSQQIQVALTTSWRHPNRRAYGEVGFLESDYFKDQIQKLVPEDHLETPIVRVSGLPESVIRTLGERCTVAKALELDLASFARRTGLDIKEAASARTILLGLRPIEGD